MPCRHAFSSQAPMDPWMLWDVIPVQDFHIFRKDLIWVFPNKWWYLGLSPLPVIVTTRIITFLVGNPYKPSFPLLLGGGTTQMIPQNGSTWRVSPGVPPFKKADKIYYMEIDVTYLQSKNWQLIFSPKSVSLPNLEPPKPTTKTPPPKKKGCESGEST